MQDIDVFEDQKFYKFSISPIDLFADDTNKNGCDIDKPKCFLITHNSGLQ